MGRELFDQCATGYDRDRRKLVPCFDDFYGAAMGLIPFPADAGIRVLDLGAGTGLLAAMVATAFPAARLHLTDISEAMLAQARQRFADNARVTFALQDHLQLSAESEYDLVLSALSLHHLEHADKKVLFRKVFRALRAGGMFINADQALGPTPQVEEEDQHRWLTNATANGVLPASRAGALERMRADKNALLADQLSWLTEAGFHDVRCPYARHRFVVYGGRKDEPN